MSFSRLKFYYNGLLVRGILLGLNFSRFCTRNFTSKPAKGNFVHIFSNCYKSSHRRSSIFSFHTTTILTAPQIVFLIRLIRLFCSILSFYLRLLVSLFHFPFSFFSILLEIFLFSVLWSFSLFL